MESVKEQKAVVGKVGMDLGDTGTIKENDQFKRRRNMVGKDK